jgi:hypothetical protein
MPHSTLIADSKNKKQTLPFGRVCKPFVLSVVEGQVQAGITPAVPSSQCG